MDAIRAGVEKAKEAVQSKKADDKAAKALDPTKKLNDRLDASYESDKAAMKAQEHACKAECYKDKHVRS
ncbi:unnamed protein product [Rotaria sp. Silwood2]|nr:unnamed protein product [Rotaria sp. Silwood2]CAF2641329.1 unnamed protein product [Rotaria sp. Silwood2]CAF3050042.1 unnamed protein product [Rotaria sp. Silwood2]CAF4233528.1 unnamed protein product [Rotaria sp. Silwood2]CAF4267436.1 unnamed protein product [Rotaria sp. Silwood2]